MAKILNLALLIFTCFIPFIHVQLIPQGDPSKTQPELKIVEIKPQLNTSENAWKSNSTRSSETKANIANPKIDKTFEEKAVEIDSGAIYRGLLVFVTFGLIFVLYVGLKTYWRRKHDKSHTVIRKYGVRTNRGDLEMEPLPLSDDDEDETVFDLSTSRLSNN